MRLQSSEEQWACDKYVRFACSYLANKELDEKRVNAEFSAKRDYTDYRKFGSIIFCNASFISWIESANFSKQMDLYITGKEVNLSECETAIKDYENERSKCRDFNP